MSAETNGGTLGRWGSGTEDRDRLGRERKHTSHETFRVIYIQDSCKELPREGQPPQLGPPAPQTSHGGAEGLAASGWGHPADVAGVAFIPGRTGTSKAATAEAEGPAAEYPVVIVCSQRQTYSSRRSSQRGRGGSGPGLRLQSLKQRSDKY